MLRHLKYKRIKILEIGIGGYESYAGGESLIAWTCYFPFALVFGCDILDKSILSSRRIAVRVVDQSSQRDLDAIQKDGPFDIIIDDGSHLNDNRSGL